MRGIILLLALAYASGVGFGSRHAIAQGGIIGSKGSVYIPDEVLVEFNTEITTEERRHAVEKVDAKQIKKLSKTNIHHLKLTGGKSVEQALQALRLDPTVKAAQPNYIYKKNSVPNDAKYGQLWGLRNSGQTIVSPGGADTPVSTNNPGTVGKDMGMESAWNEITDCSSVVIAVLDTGVNYNHVDLVANMWVGGASYPNHGYDYIDSDNNPMDLNGHGSHVAGTIGAVGNNGTGTTGVCWTAKIMAVRILDATGAGSTAQIVQGVNFAVAQGAKVINMSLGGGASDSAFSSAITNAGNNGVVVVVAAGNEGLNNDGATASYPCNYTHSNLICVAATDQASALASFSNYGSTSVDVAAPGVNIVSEWPGSVSIQTPVLTSGWTIPASTGSAWGYTTYSTVNVLAGPANYNRSTNRYVNSTNSKIYKNFSMSGASSVVMSFAALIDTESGYDYFGVAHSPAGGDPFTAGTVDDAMSGSTGGYSESFSYDISDCNTTTCTLGFALQSDSSNTSYGIALAYLDIEALTLGTTSYNVIAGTSMAAPHVAGLAALIMAYNPSYSALDVIKSVKDGGVSVAALSSKTTTGKTVNGLGSLTYIAPPTGLSLSKI